MAWIAEKSAAAALAESFGYRLQCLCRDGPTWVRGKCARNHGPIDDIQVLEHCFTRGRLAGIENAAKLIHDSFFMRVANGATAVVVVGVRLRLTRTSRLLV